MKLILRPEPRYEMTDPIRHNHETQSILRQHHMEVCCLNISSPRKTALVPDE